MFTETAILAPTSFQQVTIMSTTLIIGAGAVGCVMASYLQRHGEPVCFMVPTERLAEMAKVSHLRLDDNVAEKVHLSSAPRVADRLPKAISRVIVATKNSALDTVINQLADLPASVPVISTLNGVSHLRKLRNAFPKHDVTAATVMFNTQTIAPLHANLNTVAVVHMPPSASTALFLAAGFTVLPWDEAMFNGKLVFNVVNALGALTDTALNTAMSDPQLAACFVAAIVEAGHCVQEAKLPFTMVGALSFADYEAALKDPSASVLSILPPGGKTPRELKASMISDLERGRPTEINELNGEIEALGKAIGFPTPINSTLIALVNKRTSGQIGVINTPDLRLALGLK
jgi:2-dehydropantoate 2-reductase